MLSLLILSLLTLALFLLKKRSSHRLLPVLWVIVINALIIESFSYLVLLSMVRRGQNFYIIGNQRVLDILLKDYLLDRIHRDSKGSIYEIDNRTGYTVRNNIQKNVRIPPDTIAKIRITNNQRMRADHDYAFTPKPDVLRIAAFGDSFVFCDDEVTQNCWTYQLESSVQNLEVLNFGVSGYGLGQSYLRYLLSGLRFKPDIILFNYFLVDEHRDQFHPGNVIRGRDLFNADLYRVNFWIEGDTLCYKAVTPLDFFDRDFRKKHIYAPLGIDLAKTIWGWPVFSVSDTGLLIKQAVLRKILPEKIESIKPAIPLDVNLKILENILATAKQQQATVFFIHMKTIPSPEFSELLNRYRDIVFFANVDSMVLPLAAKKAVPETELYNETRHYSAEGNVLYMHSLLYYLSQQPWGSGQRVFRFNKEKNAFMRLH